MNSRTIVFIGRSGCGKGTQIDILAEKILQKTSQRVFHLEAGAHFRKFISESSYSSKLAKQINDHGGLQPEFLSIWAWSEELVKNLNEGDHIVIDGTPRRLSEAKILESAFDFYGRNNVDVVYMNVSNEWSIARMQERHRRDDVPESIKNRLSWFDSDVLPVLDFFQNNPRYTFHDVPAERTIEEIAQDIETRLKI